MTTTVFEDTHLSVVAGDGVVELHHDCPPVLGLDIDAPASTLRLGADEALLLGQAIVAAARRSLG